MLWHVSNAAFESVTDVQHRLAVAEGLLLTLGDAAVASKSRALEAAARLLGVDLSLSVDEAMRELDGFVVEAQAVLEAAKPKDPPFVSDEYVPTDEDGKPLGDKDDDGDEAGDQDTGETGGTLGGSSFKPADSPYGQTESVTKKKGKKTPAGMLGKQNTDEVTGKSPIAAAEQTGWGFTDTTNAGLTASDDTKPEGEEVEENVPWSSVAGLSQEPGATPWAGPEWTSRQVGGPDVNAALGLAGDQSTYSTPPNLRQATGWPRCGSCVFWQKGCNLHGWNRPPVDTTGAGQFPTTVDQICGDWRTLTPMEDRVFSAMDGPSERMMVAQEAGDAEAAIMAAARLEALAGRLDESWSDAARAAAVVARRATGLSTPEERVGRLKPGERMPVAQGVHIHNDFEHGLSVVHHGSVLSRHGTDAQSAWDAAQHAAGQARTRHVDGSEVHARGALQAAAIEEMLGLREASVAARSAAAAAAEASPPSDKYPDLSRTGDRPDANWVAKSGGLPSYIERIAKHLHYEKGKDISTAIAIAVNVVKRMCSTGDTNFKGKQNVNPVSRGEACKAVAEWEAKKAKAKATGNTAKDMAPHIEHAWLEHVAPDQRELAEALARDWEPTREFSEALARFESAYRPIPPSWNFIENLHTEIALVEGTRAWMVEMGLSIEEAASVDPDWLSKGHKFVQSTLYKGHSLAVTRHGAHHFAHVDGKMLAAPHKGKRLAAEMGKMHIDGLRESVSLAEALEEVFAPEWASHLFNPERHPRGRGGRFRDVLAKLEHEAKGRGGHPLHVSPLASMTEEQLRSAAKQHHAAGNHDLAKAATRELNGRQLVAHPEWRRTHAVAAQLKPADAGGGMDDLSVDTAVGGVLGSFPGVKDWHIEGPTMDMHGKKFWRVHVDHAQGHSVVLVSEDGKVTDGGVPELGHVPLTGVKSEAWPGYTPEAKAYEESTGAKAKVGAAIMPQYGPEHAGTGMQHISWEHDIKPGHLVDVRWTNSGIAFAAHATVAKRNKSSINVTLNHPVGQAAHGEPLYPAGNKIQVPLMFAEGMSKTTFSANNGIFPHGSTPGLPDDPFVKAEYQHPAPASGFAEPKAPHSAPEPKAAPIKPEPSRPHAEMPNSMIGPASPISHGYDPSDYEFTGDYNVPSHMQPGTIYKGSDGVHYMHMGDEWGGKGGKVKGYTSKNLKTGHDKFVPYFAVHGHEYELHQLKGTGPVKTPGQAASSADEVFANLMKSVSGQHASADEVGDVHGKNVVVTGKIPGYSRDEVHSMISAAGGTPHGSVANNTHILVTGEKVGATKINAAKAKGVRVMSWDEFKHLVEGEVPPDGMRLISARARLREAIDTVEIARLRARVELLEARGRDAGHLWALEERDYGHAERMAMAASGEALPDGSFPIKDKEDLHNALVLFNSGHGKDRAAASAHISKRAAALGASSMVKAA